MVFLLKLQTATFGGEPCGLLRGIGVIRPHYLLGTMFP